MHNSAGNKVMSGGRNAAVINNANVSKVKFVGNNYLLQGSDDSSTCLNCHAAADAAGSPNSYHVMTFPAPAAGVAPTQRTPGGDFAWLTVNTSARATYGAPVVNKGERHGHNVVAFDYNLAADTTLLTAPGGDYPAAKLSCASCHDPHSRARIVDAAGTIAVSAFGTAVKPIGASGSYGAAPDANEAVGVYRLLAPASYGQDSVTSMPFNANPPVAVAPNSYNVSEATGMTRVAYGAGMSEWCANCHRSIHNDGTDAANTALIHPAGNGAKLTADANDLNGGKSQTIAGIYNAYKKSGDLTGVQATSFESLVPFEEGTTVLATLLGHAGSSATSTQLGTTGGPSTGAENVMCLSCHRAHASGFSSAARWNNNGEFLVIAGQYPGSDAPTAEGKGGQYSRGYNQAQFAAAMYERPASQFAFAQRSLCNKCHAKD